VTHAQACHTAFDRAGLWHWVGEGRRLEHYLRTGRWQPPREEGERARAKRLILEAVNSRPAWETYG
jgi:hypothetical protein